MLKGELLMASTSGDWIASENLENLEALTNQQKLDLEAILVSGDAARAIVTGEENYPLTVEDEDEAALTTYSNGGVRQGGACRTAKVYNVSLTKVCTGGSYSASRGRVTSVSNVHSYVAYNYQPGSNITTSNPRGYASGRFAVFQADVSNTYFGNHDYGPFGQYSGTHTVEVDSATGMVTKNYGI